MKGPGPKFASLDRRTTPAQILWKFPSYDRRLAPQDQHEALATLLMSLLGVKRTWDCQLCGGAQCSVVSPVTTVASRSNLVHVPQIRNIVIGKDVGNPDDGFQARGNACDGRLNSRVRFPKHCGSFLRAYW